MTPNEKQAEDAKQTIKPARQPNLEEGKVTQPIHTEPQPRERLGRTPPSK